MKLSQARKMRDGLLKGDTVMAQAWKELISGEAASDVSAEPAASSDERGAHTLANLKEQAEGW